MNDRSQIYTQSSSFLISELLNQAALKLALLMYLMLYEIINVFLFKPKKFKSSPLVFVTLFANGLFVDAIA